MNYKNINDYELIYLVKENNEESLKILLSKYESILYNVSLKYYRKFKYIGLSLDDLLQESKIAFIKSLNNFNDDQSLLYSYVILCIDRHLISYCRSYNTLKNYPLNFSLSDEVLETATSYNSLNLDNILMDNELFFECKNSLNFNQSIVFELKFNGFTYKEISLLLDIPKTTVDGRISLIRKKLRNNLNIKF